MGVGARHVLQLALAGQVLGVTCSPSGQGIGLEYGGGGRESNSYLLCKQHSCLVKSAFICMRFKDRGFL